MYTPPWLVSVLDSMITPPQGQRAPGDAGRPAGRPGRSVGMHLQDLCSRCYPFQAGQNLLVDDNINRIMVEAAGLTRDDDVIG